VSLWVEPPPPPKPAAPAVRRRSVWSLRAAAADVCAPAELRGRASKRPPRRSAHVHPAPPFIVHWWNSSDTEAFAAQLRLERASSLYVLMSDERCVKGAENEAGARRGSSLTAIPTTLITRSCSRYCQSGLKGAALYYGFQAHSKGDINNRVRLITRAAVCATGN